MFRPGTECGEAPTRTPAALIGQSGSRLGEKTNRLGGAASGSGLHKKERSDLVPPRGVKKGSKRDRQYKHIKQSEKKAGRSTKRAEEIAARTVNKEKARSGESKSSSRSSKR